MPPEARRVPVLGAPTASGKSAVALRLAEALGFEIVSADAMQVYRGMDVGTAKSSREERARVPHHLIDVVDPDEAFSVVDWVTRAEAALNDVHARGRRALVVGGTGFYLDALARGLPTTPAADPEAQAPLWARLREEGVTPLARELAEAAPADAERAGRNPRRLVRALEIVQRTGRAPSTFPRAAPRHAVDRTWLLPPPERLDPRIDARTEAMFANGLVAEVRALLERWPTRLTATQAIGYKEVVAHLRGEATLAEAREAVRVATRRYAKRQRTWFRKAAAERRFPDVAEDVADELEAWLRAAGGPYTAP